MSELNDVALDELEVLADEGYVPAGMLLRMLLADLREAKRHLREASHRMPTRSGVYALACDEETGLWLLDPAGEWLSDIILDDNESHDAAEAVLEDHRVGSAPVFHQVSCRTIINATTGRSSQVNTFLAAVAVTGLVKSEWPQAEPITKELLEDWGPPIPHASDEAPIVNDANVLMHGLRHFKWLSNPKNDATRARDLAELGWTSHLEPFEEDLFRMFRQVHQPAA